MSNKYLTKIAAILPNFKQFGGVKGTVEAALQNPKDKARFANEGIKPLRLRKAQTEKKRALKEIGKAGVIGTGVAAGGYAVTKEKEMGNKYLEKISSSRWKVEALKRGLIEKSPSGLVEGKLGYHNASIRQSLGYPAPSTGLDNVRSQKLFSKVIDNNRLHKWNRILRE